MKVSKRIIPLFVVFATILSCFVAPVHAEDGNGTDYTNKPNFWSWAYQNSDFLQNTVGNIYGDIDHACSQSSDGRHHASGYSKDLGNGTFLCKCNECGEDFKAYAKQTYNNYVQELPANQIDSAGNLLMTIRGWHDYNAPSAGQEVVDSSSEYPFYKFYDTVSGSRNNSCKENNYILYSSSFMVPSDGEYNIHFPEMATNSSRTSGYYWIDELRSGTWYSNSKCEFSRYGSHPILGDVWSKPCDYTFSFRQGVNYRLCIIPQADLWCSDSCKVPCIMEFCTYGYITLSLGAATGVSSSYSIDYRPVSVYAPVTYTDNSGQVHTTETTIVNETDKSVYNPITGDTTTYEKWDYDYSTRTYTLTDASGQTSTVRYGDDNIQISEGNNTYNINYYITNNNGGGNDNPENPDDPTHKHDYKSEITREATCTTAGVETFTCAECNNSYTKTVPALGHDWVIKEQIPTAYDDSGEVVTQGYTIYRCSRCGEEYKSTDGKPPDGGGGSSSLWNKIGELLGTVGGGLLGLIGQLISSILDALITLAQQIGEKLSRIVEMILGWFDEIPLLFGGFLGFLEAVFPFIPADAMLLLTFGMAAVVFIGIIKALRRR